MGLFGTSKFRHKIHMVTSPVETEKENANLVLKVIYLLSLLVLRPLLIFRAGTVDDSKISKSYDPFHGKLIVHPNILVKFRPHPSFQF